MKLNIKKVIKESIADYLAELNTQNEEIQNEAALEEGASDFIDKVTKDGNIYLVKKPTKDMSEGDIVEEVSLNSLIGEGYVGAYLVSTQAISAGKKALKDRDSKLKETIEVGKSKVTELEAKIEELKRQIEDNSTRAVHDPQRRGELTETNDGLFSQLEKIEGAVEKLKTALEKESPKKAKKEAKSEKEDDKDELKEGFDLKSILRKIGWAGESWTPQEFASQIKKLDDATLIAWSKDFKGVPNTPLAFQQKLVKIELKKRGLNETSYKISSNSKEAQYLKKGDIITGGEIISVSSGARTPSGKVEVILKGKDGKTRKHIWGKFTKVGVKSKNEEKVNEGYLDYEYPKYIDNPEKFKDKEYLRNFIIYNGKPDFALEFIDYLLKNTKIIPFVYIGNKLRCKSSKGKELQFYIGEDLKHTEVNRGGFTTPLKNWSDISEYDKWDNERALKTLQQAFNK